MAESRLASSLIDEARLQSHLGRDAGAEDDIALRLTRACNRSVGWMEMRTARKLKARNYRTQSATVTSGSTAAGAATIVVGATAAMKVGDDLLCAGLEAGTQVQSITDGTTVVPTKKVQSTIASASTLTFGSAPLVLEQEDNADVLVCPQTPLLRANLFGLYWVDPTGLRTAVDLTMMLLAESVGELRLWRKYGMLGFGRYEWECRAGYEEPSSTTIGNPEEWYALVAIQLRVAEIFFMDDKNLRGRDTSLSFGAMTSSAGDYRMPADVEDGLRPFWRRGP